jgi:hypothetical protein
MHRGAPKNFESASCLFFRQRQFFDGPRFDVPAPLGRRSFPLFDFVELWDASIAAIKN